MINYINYGGADGITGACHMICTDYGNILLDCGIFQGKDIKKYSNTDFYFDVSKVDAIVLSHAHIDHCGRIPILYSMGYRGKVYGTKATKLLSKVLLEESLKIYNSSEESDKLFDDKSLDMFIENYVELDYRNKIEILKNIYVELFDAGHLLGSASIVLEINDKSIFYSGDIGKLNTPILKDPEQVTDVNYAIVESTYGSLEQHETNEFFDKFREIIIGTLMKGGKCVIPAATVGKMQEILYLLNDIYEENKFKYKVYIDSPMSTKIIDIYEECEEIYDDEAKERLDKGDNPLYFESLKYITTKEESIEVQENNEPYIVLAAGGMCEGGRIVYHLRKQIENPLNSIILIGNQNQGTLGWKLSNGVKEIKIFRDKFRVNAKIFNFPSLSGHGDCNSLVKYLSFMEEKLEKLFLVHGDRKSQEGLKNKLGNYDIEYTKFLGKYSLG
ncbi:MBL fold metallo-hydrolase [Candidatus Arthromitus sp. SFB-rat-Yit]|uniref:MBL fold metallo-hydrolase n=1 Tax=Candidatus Arthromitus sp. SFB-rat-Yit TaxID=1041504 RepID=UPI000227A5C4|nr:MBL fold metallo-hydrolase [Candidatus Arthromitus sp. SFB-rat-Yit]BAK81021.1 metallo-beta-lactamase family protein [Candidatus Arthromitus sp. SFB-rat-Yit]